MRKINDHPWDAKNSMDLDSRPWHALTISSFSVIIVLQKSLKLKSMRPSEKNVQKMFDLHLLNTKKQPLSIALHCDNDYQVWTKRIKQINVTLWW